RGPGFDFVRAPRFVIVVRDDWIANAQRSNLLTNVVSVSFTIKLRRVYTDNCQTFIAVTFVPLLDEGQCVAAVVATESPELDQHDAIVQSFDRKWSRIDPGARSEFGRRGSVGLRRHAVGGDQAIVARTGQSHDSGTDQAEWSVPL